MEWNKSIKELNFIFDASHNGIMVVDENGIIVIYNRAAGKVLKRNPALLIGRPAREALPHAWPDLKRILETGISQIGIKLTFGESSIVANRT
ncbi:MAG: PAS domain-containing protein, partial [Deltaproteobacteria bacterium]|nr:PAS domain-containing protein [Deltaproteobacteria bacterium]